MKIILYDYNIIYTELYIFFCDSIELSNKNNPMVYV